MEEDSVGDRAGDRSWREVLHAGSSSGGTVTVGDQHWSRDTPRDPGTQRTKAGSGNE